MTTINNQNPIYPDYRLGKLTAGSKQVTIRDLMKYAKKKSCGRLWMFIQWIFSGKGLITKETASTLLQRHPQRDKILEEFKILRTLIKTQAVVQPIIEKKEPFVLQLPIAKTTEQETPVASTKQIEEQKIEKIAPVIDESNVQIDTQKVQEKRLFDEYLRKGYSELLIKQAIQVEMKVEDYAALLHKDLEEEIRAQAKTSPEKLSLNKQEPKQEQKRENIITSPPLEARVNNIESDPEVAVKPIIKQAIRTQRNSYPTERPKQDQNDRMDRLAHTITLRERIGYVPPLELRPQTLTTSQKSPNEGIRHQFSSDDKQDEVESPTPSKQEEAPKESENLALSAVALKNVEMPHKIAVPSNEEMDLNEAYRIIGEALRLQTSNSPVNELSEQLDAEWLPMFYEIPENLFLKEKLYNASRKGIVILEWALQNREFPQLYKVMNNLISCRSLCQKIEAADNVEPEKRMFFKALRQACLAIEEEAQVELPSVDPSAQPYDILEDAFNTIDNHRVHKSKYGSALHYFLIELHRNVYDLASDLEISIPPEHAHPALYLFHRVSLDKEMPDLYSAMKTYPSSRAICRKIRFSNEIEDPKLRFMFTVLYNASRSPMST